MTTSITSPSYILSRDQYQAYHAFYKAKAINRQLTPADILIHNMVRGLPLDRGFTPITNPIKLANGAQPLLAFDQAKASMRWILKRQRPDFKKIFSDNITDEQVETFAAML